MNRIKFSLNNRLSLINQRSFAENIPKSTLLFIVVCIISITYFGILYSLFHTLWYHKLFCVISTLIFAYSLQDLYFEQLEKRVKQALPKTTKKLSHYYTHYKGNVIPTLMDTEEKCPEEARLYLVKIRKALISGNPGNEINALKSAFPFIWFRMLASIIFMSKEKGIGVKSDANQTNMIGRNLMKMTNILNFINVQQGYNDAELKYIQIFLYFAPFLFIFASDWINSKILIEMNLQEVYQGIKAQNIKTFIFLSANLSALFIHWMRKQQR
ncbi:MAG: hypothetical protein A2Y23_15470 [Clostridiales bacterium GWB2_37_7]|nr:MAG: hypothetical protein A2Y23_15470 [Clostridiales bacterium GWB2_37_7]